MCGIFGLIVKDSVKYEPRTLKQILVNVAVLSESRGKDSSGICFRRENVGEFSVVKATTPVSKLIQNNTVKTILNEATQSFQDNRSTMFTSFGHSRLVTNGSQLHQVNNQPVIKDGLIATHNGIIVNVDDLWTQFPQLKRNYEIDTEVMLSLMRYFLDKGLSSIEAVTKTFSKIIGTVATVIFFDDRDEAILATNNGSLYYATNNTDFFLYASEGFIVKEIINDLAIENITGPLFIRQLKANTAISIDLVNMASHNYEINSDHPSVSPDLTNNKNINMNTITINGGNSEKSAIINSDKYRFENSFSTHKALLEFNVDKINNLKRCSICLLPETFPFITFDSDGKCNYCTNYVKKNQPKPYDMLEGIVNPYRRNNGEPDCLVPFSGGRDSTFVLHYVKKVLGLNPIAYTYDWGMVTDLGRRNIARVCGKLGVENIIVAADIKKKRNNIKMNINAWLKNPELGMIPLFMAGDKQFFKYANMIKKQAKIDLNIWGINFLENTDFKVGFCGVPPDWHKKMIYSMSGQRMGKLFGYVAKNVMQSPSYINPSLFDTLESFLSRYANPRKDYYHFFDYYEWNEKEIDDLLVKEYDWELAKDIKSSWRIGDGTASFYNYIYYTVAGFSEFDTFRSNQIREGMISREQGMELIKDENIPRYESLRWYLDIIGLDFTKVINIINRIPKLY
jgi:glutamine---fructose-6-phosphate transaminase (isomerizing)